MSEKTTLRHTLISDAKTFCKREGISLARLGRIVMNHGGFFKRLEGGGDCKTAVYERFQSIFKDGAEWESAKAEARERDSKTSAEAVT